MNSKSLWLLSIVVLLSACQQHDLRPIPEPVDPVPPTLDLATQPPGSLMPPLTTPEQNKKAVAKGIITFHLAQEVFEPELFEVDIEGVSLYAIPTPVLTEVDIAEITPLTTSNNENYLVFDMNAQGKDKLLEVTQQAAGYFLLLSVNGQLASLTQINDVITEGSLLIGTKGKEHSKAIIDMMR